ncbi:hypothetical protein [Quisquiliibacterium transsilvanicum]|uniref:Uncharacterized protein n=1 Tax=Quisquiliibacterium transsilvanicum TaxID=1549638 RepID=A0A7W8M7R6_9BURK|nr:hypothetical protein [Quisquiliibacterium transsilvanicum]MBB5271048.1 hypothetical protein [Quisquiliibacterium transsilvanicum]
MAPDSGARAPAQAASGQGVSARLPILGASRRLLSIYEDAPYRNAGAILVFVCGLVLLARLSPLAMLPFLVLVWANADRLALRVDSLLGAAPWLLVAIPAAAILARLVLQPPAASDDLLRHIASAFWPRGYQDMYVHTALPPHPLYPGFDGLLGYLAQRIGLPATMWLAQAAAFACYSFAVIGAGLRVLSGREDRWFWVAAGWLLLCSLLALRLSLARPEVFMAAWAISAVIPRSRGGIALWVVIGVALGSAYWLAPIYYTAALLLQTSLRARLAIAAALGTAWALLWLWLTGGELVATFVWPLEAVGRRIPELSVGENVSIFAMVSAPEFVLLAAGAAWAIGKGAAEPRFVLLAGFFLLSNQIRYANVVAAMFMLCALGLIAAAKGEELLRSRTQSGAKLRSVVAAVLLLCALSIPPQVPKWADQVRFQLPPGSVVLAGNMPPMYSMLFHNPGRIRISPGFELGAARPEVQRAILDLGSGRLDCVAVLALGFTHLVENSFAGVPASCMRLEATQNTWRLWRLAAP